MLADAAACLMKRQADFLAGFANEPLAGGIVLDERSATGLRCDSAPGRLLADQRSLELRSWTSVHLHSSEDVLTVSG